MVQHQHRIRGKSVDQWIDEYAQSHQNGFNRLCHTWGIPMILISLILIPIGILSRFSLYVGIGLFVLGWTLQFVGHAVEGKPPEFLKDWRFLFVGVRWWVRKMKGKV